MFKNLSIDMLYAVLAIGLLLWWVWMEFTDAPPDG